MFKIQIAELLTKVGEKKTVTIEVPLQYSDDFCTVLPLVMANLTITNLGELLLVTGLAKASVSLACNRCAKSYTEQIIGDVEQEFRSEDQLFQFNAADRQLGPDDLQFTIDAKGNIDIEETLREVILSNLPLKPVCADCPEAVNYTVK